MGGKTGRWDQGVIGAFSAVLLLMSLDTTTLRGTAAAAPGDSDDWKKRLQAEIEAAYPPRKTDIFGRMVKQEGSILLIRKDGIRGDPPFETLVQKNIFRDGQQVKAGGGSLLGGRGRSFPVGEKVVARKVKVGDKEVEFQLSTIETFNFVRKGESTQQPYVAYLVFEFDRGHLPTAPANEVLAQIRSVVVTESEATAVQTKTVELGQSPDEVIGILGKPDNEVKLGGKTIFVYKNLKVVFVDGKVTDVQ